jgi:hypothetical protein
MFYVLLIDSTHLKDLSVRVTPGPTLAALPLSAAGSTAVDVGEFFYAPTYAEHIHRVTDRR